MCLCNIHTAYLPVKNEFDITTLYTLIIVTRRFYRASACYACRARYCFTNPARLSVCPMSVCAYRNEYCHTFCYSGRGIIPVFVLRHRQKIPMGIPLAGAVNTRGGIFLIQFSTEIAVCLGNGTCFLCSFVLFSLHYVNGINKVMMMMMMMMMMVMRYAKGCYRTLIGSHR